MHVNTAMHHAPGNYIINGISGMEPLGHSLRNIFEDKAKRLCIWEVSSRRMPFYLQDWVLMRGMLFRPALVWPALLCSGLRAVIAAKCCHHPWPMARAGE